MTSKTKLFKLNNYIKMKTKYKVTIHRTIQIWPVVRLFSLYQGYILIFYLCEKLNVYL